MGCFDVVCSLTNVPIHYGDKCYLVVLKKDCSWDSIVWLNEPSGGRISVDTVFHGLYNDYGSVEKTKKLNKKQEHLLSTFFDHMSDNQRKYFFVCDTAWKWCQEKYKDWTPRFVIENREFRALFTKRNPSLPGLKKLHKADEKREEQDIALARVLRAFSSACKHPLSGLGQYHQYGGEEITDIKEHLELVLKRLTEIEKRYEDD
jgi:hypothetical protein